MSSLTNEQLANRVDWIRALRSGRFKQAKYSLKTVLGKGFGHCCLGVACEIIDPNSDLLTIIDASSESVGLNTPERIQFGITDSDQNTAMGWNDEGNFIFKRIADFIAWATENNLAFEDVNTKSVPRGYSANWLKQFD